MRIKVGMMIAMAVVLVTLVGSGPALAQMIGGVIQCQTMPCVASGDHQVLFERVGDGVRDRMIARTPSAVGVPAYQRTSTSPPRSGTVGRKRAQA